MADPLLRTKLFVPPLRPNIVSRPHLIERLDQSLQSGHKLTLISAPAGFGKTTLASEWAGRLVDADNRAHPTCRVTWLALDESDNDPTRFLTYLVAALDQVSGDDNTIGGNALEMQQSPQPPPTEAVLTSLINDIAAVDVAIAFILDDYHLIDSPAVDEVLTFLLEHMPPQIHLVIATREDPQLPLARLRARGQLTELRASDLRFSSAEAAEFLNQVMGLGLSSADIAALEARTEGWIAGLHLAAISLQGSRTSTDLIKSFTGSHRFVLDYLIEEVLEQQPENVQDFLLQTAVLERLTGPLCDALTGQDDSQATLQMLERANLFIVPLDNERRWYRYHHLFAQLLRRHLQQNRPELPPILHQRASTWFEQNGFIDEAIEHMLQKRDFERAADLIEAYVDDFWQQGRQAKLYRWLDRIPIEVDYTRPHICILQAGLMLTHGRIEEAEKYLQAAGKLLSPDVPTDLPLAAPPSHVAPETLKQLGRAAAIRANVVSYHGHEQESIQWARQALAYLPESDLTWRSSALDSIASAYETIGSMQTVYAARLEALQASKEAGNIYLILLASLRFVVTLREMGHLQQAQEICRQQLQFAIDHGMAQLALVGWLYTLWGEILAEKNELDQAYKLAAKGMEQTKRGKDVILLGSSYLSLMRVLFSKGAYDEALQIIAEVHESGLQPDLSTWVTNQLAAWQARIWLAQHRLDAAGQWAAISGISTGEELSPIHDYEYAVLARILIAQGQVAQASRLLGRLLAAAEARGRTTKQIELLILQALAFLGAGDADRALEALEEALRRAQPRGFVRIFADEGPDLARLLTEALSRGISADYVQQILTAFLGTTADRTTEPEQVAMIEPLSDRELDVLQYVAQGLSNREIAAQLYLSLNTVKVHTRNIYGKLDVNSRTQAVARARSLGLLILD